MTKQSIEYHSNAKKRMLNGVETARKIAEVTFGPAGLAVSKPESYGSGFRITKDGYTVLQDLKVEDPVEQIGVSMVVKAATNINNAVGDNTTTAGILTAQMILKMSDALSETSNLNLFQEGLEWAHTRALSLLDDCAVDVDSGDIIGHVATVAANGDEKIGDIISNVHNKIGDGSVSVELSNSTETSYEIVDGFEIDAGYVSPYFATNPRKQTCELDKPLVLISEEKINALEPILPLLQHVSNTAASLLVIAEDIEGEALSTFIINKLKVGFKVGAIKAPSFGQRKTEILQDIAALTGAKVISPTLGNNLRDAQHYLGRATFVKVGKDKTAIINTDADKSVVDARCNQIREELNQCTSEYDRKQLQERYSRLKYGAALIRVGGANEELMKAHRDLVEDAVLAVKAAVEEGVTPGGGAVYTTIASCLRNELVERKYSKEKHWGCEAFIEALEVVEPTILKNALQSQKDVAKVSVSLEEKRDAKSSLREQSRIGYDSRQKIYCDDLIACGVLDSKKGVRCCISEAVAQTIIYLRTGAVIVELPDKKDDNQSDSFGM